MPDRARRGTVDRLLRSDAPAAMILIRLMVGGIFLSEGIQKFIYPGEVGVGRFERIGIPDPEFTAPLVGAVETICGLLVITGTLTRLAVVPLLIVVLVALATTKVPILLGRDLGPFAVRDLPYYGFWGAAHEARTDLSMVLGSIVLLIVGAGRLSVDHLLTRGRRE